MSAALAQLQDAGIVLVVSGAVVVALAGAAIAYLRWRARAPRVPPH